MDNKIVIPPREEYEKLLEEIAKLDERARDSAKLVQLLALSGMRLAEATRIVCREVDFEKGQFTVSGGEDGTKNRETRIVPLFPRLRRFLEEIRPEGGNSGEKRIVGIDTSISLSRDGGVVKITAKYPSQPRMRAFLKEVPSPPPSER